MDRCGASGEPGDGEQGRARLGQAAGGDGSLIRPSIAWRSDALADWSFWAC